MKFYIDISASRPGGAFVIIALFVLIISSPFAQPAHAEDADGLKYEFVMGVGTNINGEGAAQMLVGPSFSFPFKGKRDVRIRVEGTVELMDKTGEGDPSSAFVVGATPFVRFLRPGGGGDVWTPFFEFGVGANYISVTRFGNRWLGGHFTFSVNAAAGAKLMLGNLPVSASYRYRHLSNGYTYPRNMGLDAHYLVLMFGL